MIRFILAFLFLFLFIVNFMMSQKIREKVIEVSGIDKYEAQEYWNSITVVSRKSRGDKMLKWLLKNTEYKDEVKKYWYLGSLYIFPGMICLAFIPLSFIIQNIKTLFILAIILSIIIMSLAILTKK